MTNPIPIFMNLMVYFMAYLNQLGKIMLNNGEKVTLNNNNFI